MYGFNSRVVNVLCCAAFVFVAYPKYYCIHIELNPKYKNLLSNQELQIYTLIGFIHHRKFNFPSMILLLYIELAQLLLLLLFFLFSFRLVSLSLLLFVCLAEFKHQPYLSNNLTAIKNETVQPSHSIRLQAVRIQYTHAHVVDGDGSSSSSSSEFVVHDGIK